MVKLGPGLTARPGAVLPAPGRPARLRPPPPAQAQRYVTSSVTRRESRDASHETAPARRSAESHLLQKRRGPLTRACHANSHGQSRSVTISEVTVSHSRSVSHVQSRSVSHCSGPHGRCHTGRYTGRHTGQYTGRYSAAHRRGRRGGAPGPASESPARGRPAPPPPARPAPPVPAESVSGSRAPLSLRRPPQRPRDGASARRDPRRQHFQRYGTREA
jgi:hypothetical protein